MDGFMVIYGYLSLEFKLILVVVEMKKQNCVQVGDCRNLLPHTLGWTRCMFCLRSGFIHQV